MISFTSNIPGLAPIQPMISLPNAYLPNEIMATRLYPIPSFSCSMSQFYKISSSN